jgi:hypothetical protein
VYFGGEGKPRRKGGVRVKTIAKLLGGVPKGVTIDDTWAHQKPKIFFSIGDRDVVPTYLIKPALNPGEVVGGTSGEKNGFRDVEAQPATTLKEVENFFYAGKFKDANQVITRRSVIREHAGGQRFDGAEEGVEHIHEENKEEGGERAALFNASIEVNTSRFGTWEGSVTVGVSEKHSNSLDDVGGEADLGEEGKDDFVVAAVKGLGKVIEDKVIMFPSFKGAIEGFIVKEDVVIHLSPSEEAKLVKRDNV